MKHLLLLLVLLLVSLPVPATKPDTYTFEFPDLIEVADCGEFRVMDNAWVVLEFKDFYDKKDNYIRTQIHATGFDDLYSDADPEGIHLTGTAHTNFRYFFNDSDELLLSQAGLAVGIMVPGYGPLFLDAGRLVWNEDTGDLIFSAGNNHDWNFGEYDALCKFFE